MNRNLDPSDMTNEHIASIKWSPIDGGSNTLEEVQLNDGSVDERVLHVPFEQVIRDAVPALHAPHGLSS
jgi:hypothetical protein